ncbi:MAG: ECF-type sigma factor [Wenzhouxiangellaceae bacterium]
MQKIQQHEAGADDEALEPVYQALRQIARRERARNPSNTLNTTVLVHEAWLKLEQGQRDYADLKHEKATYALAIRQILVDYARGRASAKRTPSDEYEQFQIGQQQPRTADEILAMDQALTRLEQVDERLARLVELRFFVGLSTDDAADVLDISRRTAARDWQRARAFLKAVLE